MTARQTPVDLSFIIPVRDDAARLERCLESVARNRRPGISMEVIVADNGSRDGSAAIARRFGARVLDGSGCSVAQLRNRAAALARGDVLAFVDADHEIGSGWVEAVAQAFLEPGVAAAGAPYSSPPHATWVQRWYGRLREHAAGRHDAEWLGAGNMAVDRRVFQGLGGFDTSLETCEDVDLCQRIRQAGRRILSDSRVSTTHFGDPPTLGAVFFGELWRGRDNLRVTLRGPRTLRHFRSLVIPLVDLAALVVIVTGAALLTPASVAAMACAAGTVFGLAAMRASVMFRRGPAKPSEAAAALMVATAYDAGRACALIARATHRSRRR